MVELFGGSGLLSNAIKHRFPQAQVVWNDYDNFTRRLEQIPQTNQLLHAIRKVVADTPWQDRLTEEQAQEIRTTLQLGTLVDCDVTSIAANLCFSGERHNSLEKLLNSKAYYNRVRKNDYHADGYLHGVVRVQEDAFVILDKLLESDWTDQHVIILVDPPYISTCTNTYQAWKLEQFLKLTLKLAELDLPCCFWGNSKSGMCETVNSYQQLVTRTLNPSALELNADEREILRQAMGAFSDLRVTERTLDDHGGRMIDGKEFMIDNFTRYYK